MSTVQTGQDLLGERVRLLDEGNPVALGEGVFGRNGIHPDIGRFITVLSVVTSHSGSGSQSAPITGDVADRILGRSRLLQRLEAHVPVVMTEPLAQDLQFWVRDGRPGQSAVPNANEFMTVSQARHPPGAKPAGHGIYTSTGVCGTFGMWWAYLIYYAGSTLHPYPWSVWSVFPDRTVRIREITSASDWVRFVGEVPKTHNGLIYPDWASAATRWDAVHLTAKSVAAIQGMYFSSRIGVVAPSYWDVESTVWLRWSFNRVVRKLAVSGRDATGEFFVSV